MSDFTHQSERKAKYELTSNCGCIDLTSSITLTQFFNKAAPFLLSQGVEVIAINAVIIPSEIGTSMRPSGMIFEVLANSKEEAEIKVLSLLKSKTFKQIQSEEGVEIDWIDFS